MGTRVTQQLSGRRRRFGPGRTGILAAQGARGRQFYNLWYHYSTRLRRDVILKSDAEFEHFCWIEGDPRILKYELEPEPSLVVVNGEVSRTQFDARVEFRSGVIQLREIKDNEDALTEREEIQKSAQIRAAEAAGFQYLRITRADLSQHRQFISNWRRALAFTAACRDLVLEPFCTEIETIFRREQRATIREAMLKTDPALRSIYLAATFVLLQNARLQSDLDSKPLCNESKLWLGDVSNA